MKVIVTGASGFIGQHVCSSFLDAGHIVYATTNKGTILYDHPNLTVHKIDLFCREQIEELFNVIRPECLVHCAWYAKHGEFWHSEENFNWVKATLEILEAFQKYGGHRAIFTGTCAEYDWRYGLCDEEITPLSPKSLYAITKDATRRLVTAYCEFNNLECVWGRIFFPFGEGEDSRRLIPSIIDAAINYRSFDCNNPDGYRDFIAVEDLASAICHLATNTEQTGIFNLSTGLPTRISEVVEYTYKMMGQKFVPEIKSTKSVEPKFIIGNSEKLKHTGWLPQHSWKSAIDKVIQIKRS
jgi:nucleoside-diphosphate-sugar epimerase